MAKKNNMAACKAEVDAMRAQFHREVQAPDIVKAGKNPSSPFHRHLEWDNKRAGHAHRIWQARMLMARLATLYPNHKGKPSRGREFIWIPKVSEAGKDSRYGSYTARGRVEKEKGLLIQLVEGALKDQERLIQSYQTISALHGVIPLMEAVVAKINGVLAHLKKKAN